MGTSYLYNHSVHLSIYSQWSQLFSYIWTDYKMTLSVTSRDLRENYCRNPDGQDFPWCFTTDPRVRTMFCTNIPQCGAQNRPVNGERLQTSNYCFSLSLVYLTCLSFENCGVQTRSYYHVEFLTAWSQSLSNGVPPQDCGKDWPACLT